MVDSNRKIILPYPKFYPINPNRLADFIQVFHMGSCWSGAKVVRRGFGKHCPSSPSLVTSVRGKKYLYPEPRLIYWLCLVVITLVRLPMLSMKEKELIEGALRGEEQASRLLFERYAPMLMAVCQRYCRTQAEAEDVLQDSFIRIFNKLPKYGFQGSFAGWVRRLTVNVALQTYQRKRYTQEQSGLENIPERGGAPTAYAELGEKELLDLVQALPDGYRLVFNLYAIEG